MDRRRARNSRIEAGPTEQRAAAGEAGEIEAAARLSRLQFEDETAGDRASASGPFRPELNQALAGAFGRDLSPLTATFGDADSTQALGAAAYTRGSHMVFGPEVKQDLGDSRSMTVVGHEVAHALGGSDGAHGGVDRPGSTAEATADASGRRFADWTAGDRRGPAPRLEPAVGEAQVHRMSVGGPGNMKDAVHEKLTLESLIRAGVVPADAKLWDPATVEYLRGVYWNDDPEGLQFGGTRSRAEAPGEFATGFRWLMRFMFGDKERNLTARSHHGDMQFLHGMASQDGEPPEVTKGNIAVWIRFAAQVATGRIPGETAIAQTALAPFFPGEAGQANVYALFIVTASDPGVLRQRATGSLLHAVQDSHARGHTERNARGEIVEFHSYGSQDHGEHGAYDDFHGEEEGIAGVPGGEAAVNHGERVLELLQQGDPEVVIAYFLDEVLRLAPDARPAGPGHELRRRPTPKVDRLQPPEGFVETRRDSGHEEGDTTVEFRATLTGADGAEVTFVLSYWEKGGQWSLRRSRKLSSIDGGHGFPSTDRVYLAINPALGFPAGTLPRH